MGKCPPSKNAYVTPAFLLKAVLTLILSLRNDSMLLLLPQTKHGAKAAGCIIKSVGSNSTISTPEILIMKTILSLLVILFIAPIAVAQNSNFITGTIINAQTAQPLEGATVFSVPGGLYARSDERGRFVLPKSGGATHLSISSVGHTTQNLSLADFEKSGNIISIDYKNITLSDVIITASPASSFNVVGKLDVKLRGINNAQEVLRFVPGLFIGQHAGGGKAEQIFLRGFDIDHGTDISIGVDGMPVNLVSHAHGQGYADLHFVIPETIEDVRFKKGSYDAAKGNFATTGFVEMKTLNVIENNTIKVEAGMFNTYRTVGLFNLLPKSKKEFQPSAYIAGEYLLSKGYFDAPQNLNRINLFAKYYQQINSHQTFSFSASGFYSKWNASGQIPQRSVDDGSIDFFGAIDPNEGGSTSRYNINAMLTSTLRNGDYFRNQLFYAKYDFELFSNFTFFKEDAVNGDQIKQKEKRDLVGYNGSYHKTIFMGVTKITSETGVNIRVDYTNGSELSRTKNRSTVLSYLQSGNIQESNLAAYSQHTIAFNKHFSIQTGLRFDYFKNRYQDALQGGLDAKVNNHFLSPKFSFFYHANKQAEFYLSAGRGFHSNDTRSVVKQNGLNALPAANSYDVGTILKPTANLIINAALWHLQLNQEFVYVGDEGIVEPAGRTRRYGADVSLRYQPVKWLFADADINYAHARLVDEQKGENYIPLAPSFTSTGGIKIITQKRLSAALRYRYMANRAANETNSVVAEGYCIADASVQYNHKQFEIGLDVQNILDTRWKETQFETESRLQNEPSPVSEIHFTPGTPFFAKLRFSIFF